MKYVTRDFFFFFFLIFPITSFHIQLLFPDTMVSMVTMMEDMSLVSDIRDLDEHHGTSITNKNGYGVFYAYTVFYCHKGKLLRYLLL